MSQVVDVQECETCKKQYNVTVEWPFSLCEECAKKKWTAWQDMVVTEVFGLDEENGWLAPFIPPMSLKLSNFFTKKIMTKEDAARIQSHADKTGTNQDFKARAQSAAAKYRYIVKLGNNDCALNVIYDDDFKMYLIKNPE